MSKRTSSQVWNALFYFRVATVRQLESSIPPQVVQQSECTFYSTVSASNYTVSMFRTDLVISRAAVSVYLRLVSGLQFKSQNYSQTNYL